MVLASTVKYSRRHERTSCNRLQEIAKAPKKHFKEAHLLNTTGKTKRNDAMLTKQKLKTKWKPNKQTNKTHGTLLKIVTRRFQEELQSGETCDPDKSQTTAQPVPNQSPSTFLRHSLAKGLHNMPGESKVSLANNCFRRKTSAQCLVEFHSTSALFVPKLTWEMLGNKPLTLLIRFLESAPSAG